MNDLLKHIDNIGQTSAALAVLQGLRAKLERDRRQPNRLWKHFPALKMVILTGKAGSGKTHVVKSIYEGLDLPNSEFLSIWVEGASTCVGRREKLQESPISAVCWNEISIYDLQDVKLLKQLAEGVISFMKHGSLDETPFSGILIGTTNEFMAKGRCGKDLEALRDRCVIVEVGPPVGYNPLLAIDKNRTYLKDTKSVDWGMIWDALLRETDEILSKEEEEKIKPLWALKTRECLDGRILTRAGADYRDCFIFCKRLFGSLDEEDVFNATVLFAHDSVAISAIPVAHLSVIQRDIVEALTKDDSKTLPISKLREYMINVGRFSSNSSLYRHLTKLIESGLLIKTTHGEYSLLKPIDKNEDGYNTKFEQLLRTLH